MSKSRLYTEASEVDISKHDVERVQWALDDVYPCEPSDLDSVYSEGPVSDSISI